MSDIEILTESAYGIRHSCQLKFPIISQRNALAMSKINFIKRAQSADDINNKNRSFALMQSNMVDSTDIEPFFGS